MNPRVVVDYSAKQKESLSRPEAALRYFFFVSPGTQSRWGWPRRRNGNWCLGEKSKWGEKLVGGAEKNVLRNQPFFLLRRENNTVCFSVLQWNAVFYSLFFNKGGSACTFFVFQKYLIVRKPCDSNPRYAPDIRIGWAQNGWRGVIEMKYYIGKWSTISVGIVLWSFCIFLYCCAAFMGKMRSDRVSWGPQARLDSVCIFRFLAIYPKPIVSKGAHLLNRTSYK